MTPKRRRHSNQPKTKQRSRSTTPATRAAKEPAAPPRQYPLPIQFDPAISAQLEVTERRFSGPLPPPEVLNQYNNVVPGMADDILRMAQEEQAFRHRIVEKAVDANIASDKRGQWMAVSLAVLGFAIALVLGLAGHPAAGAIVAALDIAGVVGLFLQRQRGEKDEDKPQLN